MADATEVSYHYKSYEDFLSSFKYVNPKINAVYEFLTQLHLLADEDDRPIEGAYIVSELEEGLQVEPYEKPSALCGGLESHAASTSTHLVLLHYSNHGLFFKTWLEAIGFHFDLDPIFLFHSLELCSDGGKFIPLHEIDTVQDLVSRRRSLELGCAPWVHGSIVLKRGRGDAHDTVVMLLHTTELGGSVRKGVVELDTPGLTTAPMYEDELRAVHGFASAYLRELKSHYRQAEGLTSETIVLSFCTKIAQYFSSSLAEYRWRHRKQLQDLDDTNDIEKLEKLAKKDNFPIFRWHYDLNLERLRSTIDSLEHPGPVWKANLANFESRPAWSTMMNDFRHILDIGERDRQQLRDHMAYCFQHFRFATALNSRHQNALNRSLSILAFLYLPLSLVSSLFGMNIGDWISPDSQGQLSLWLPIACGFGLLGAMIAILLFIPFCSWLIKSSRCHLGWLPGRLYIIAKFARYRPDYSFWILLFTLTHHHFITFDLCRRLGIDDVIWGRAEWVRPYTFTIKTRFLSPFWQRQWWLVANYLQDPEWHQKPLFRKWWRPRPKPQRRDSFELAENGFDRSGAYGKAIDDSLRQHRREWRTLPAHNHRPYYPDRLSQVPGYFEE